MRLTNDRCRLQPLVSKWVASVVVVAFSVPAWGAQPPDARAIARQVDKLITGELKKAGADTTAPVPDEDFLRRISFDLAGTAPLPREVTLFGFDSDPQKREKMIEQLLASNAYAQNWSRYWRNVIFSRATNMRAPLAQLAFETWMTDQFSQNRGWDEIATSIVTATGDVRENGATALMFVQEGQPADIAAETSRIFLGIQMQCANCHDHPTDNWKREQFHQLAAFFPRVGLRRIQDNGRTVSWQIVSVNFNRQRGGFLQNPQFMFRRFDRNNDQKLSKAETARSPIGRFFDRFLQLGDSNKDGALSLEELRKLPQPMAQAGRGSQEHFMPDLSNPGSQGDKMDPVFFVTKSSTGAGATDLERRRALSEYLTAPSNPWFARAFVNRMWTELLGQGFYMPIDDIGPEREAVFPDVLELLSTGFVSNSYDVKWLVRTITNTQTYQRQIRMRDAADVEAPFAAGTPTRLRSDQLYSAITRVLEVQQLGGGAPRGRGPYGRGRSPRAGFNAVFGFDPSTPQEDITGNVPQALYMMNSPTLNRLIRAEGNTRLGRILREFDDNEDAVSELYLLALAREPSKKEVKICLDYVKRVKNRKEAFEDLLWSLLNSSEFLSKR